MTTIKRVFLIVLDSAGIGFMPDAVQFGDAGSNTLKRCWDSGKLDIRNMQMLGVYNIDEIGFGHPVEKPQGAYGKLAMQSFGKDTTIGHWEIAGLISENALPTYPAGFPDEVIQALKNETGYGILCNQPYSGTEVLLDYGLQHQETGKLIVYSSADSVFQIAAHEELVPIEELYRICEIARKILTGKHSVGRVIARPFVGSYPEFKRTIGRHDYSLAPPGTTLLDSLQKEGLDTLAVGKVHDIFAGKGINKFWRTTGNESGMKKTIELAQLDFHGLCFVNLVDFDMLYGHRNDVDGYVQALNTFDVQFGEFLRLLRADDVVMITADHGCDPGFPGTDHTREYVPWLIAGDSICEDINLHIMPTFANIASTIMGMLGLENIFTGEDLSNLLFRPEGKGVL